jgi:outer membrane protein assembly factor BamA
MKEKTISCEQMPSVFSLKYLLIFFIFIFQGAVAQTAAAPVDSLSRFQKFNQKAEAFFKIIPVPIVSYSSEAGNIFGLAKFNVFHPVKSDTISEPSKLAESITFSTKGRVSISISNDLILKEDKYVFISSINYRKQPEYILGIGNDVSIDDAEEITSDRIRFNLNALRQVSKDLYAGIVLDLADYINIETDSTSFLIQDQVLGLAGGTDFGMGLSVAFDSRDNRYNASKGAFISSSIVFYDDALGSAYNFNRFELDARKYFNPWLGHTVALQATTTAVGGNVPFYDLAMLGGEDKMRGYYKGALRDKVLVDAQFEYRMPVWEIFGITGWIGTGRVAESYKNLSLDGYWISYGGGLRVKVDSKENINLRVDFGFGPAGISGVYFNFAEAF